jgi:PAS domain S-box-containing protein
MMTIRRYKFLLFFFLAQIVFANMTMAQNQRIIVGVLENSPPQYMTDPKTKEPTGFAVDIIKEAARLSGLDISYKVFKEWPVLNQALHEKKVDVIPNMGIIAERENLFKYTIPVETTKISFFVRKTSNDINSEKDLTGRAISVVETNKGRFLMEERGWGNLKIYQSFDEALMSLVSGISDGVVYPDPPFMNILQQYGLSDRIKVVGEPLLEIKRAIAVHRDHSDLVNKLNDSVKVLMSSEKYKEIYTRWYGKPAPFWSVKRVAVIMGIFISIIGLALLAWRFYSVMKLNNSLLVQTQKRSIAEEALHASREDLIESQRIAHVGSWRLDIKSNQVVWSEELYKMYGFDHTLPPPPYTEHQKLFTPESWNRLSAALNNTIDKGIPYELELETVREDGSHGWMWVHGQTLLNTKGEMVGLRGATQDITGRKLAENEQRLLLERAGRLSRAMLSALEDQRRTKEQLLKRMDELQRFHDVTMDRELTMVALKKEVNELLKQAGREEKYRIVG